MDDKLPPIAIVGMSWRFPSEARSAKAYYHPSADRQGAIINKEGHFLKEDIAAFDAPFFSMTATEAEGMDPQHRILLEVTMVLTAARIPEGVEYPLPIHPTLLDAVFQMMICCRTVKDNSPAMAPSRIESLYVSASIPPVGSCMSGYSTLNPKLRLQQSGNAVLSDAAWSEPKVILKGFVCTELTSTQLRHTPRKICTRMDWRMDVLSSQTTTGRFWKSLPVLSPASSKQARAWNRAAILCAQKASSTLRQLEGGQVTSPTLARYIDCLKIIAVEPLDETFGESGNLESCPVMQTIDTVGSRITHILSRSNESEPIVTSDLISKFLNDAIDRSFVNSVVSNFIDRAGDVNPDSHILELGDGSTSCAMSVL
ncbi:polyketide synthase [Aspergillus brasiliensis]|uniref:Polyketide synthase n=1 Tax=Aspergillus brasiliensis TaxID=319629 RepID=A0A9W5Z3K0_9EURO|nr:polyketide synthase [Aspergillus brasiliensis]GKZ50656.1 polyketide synthase [Aspergillus brasiliensis]